MDIGIGMRAAEMVTFAEKLLAEATNARDNGKTFEVTVYAENNIGSRGEVILTFNNDDMEREEMTGRTIVDFDEE